MATHLFRTTTYGAVLGLSVLLAACGGGGDGPPVDPDPTITGTYQLESVRGSEIPTAVGFGDCSETVTDGSLQFNAGQTFSWSETREGRSPACAGEIAQYESSGSFTLSGGDVAFSEPRMLGADWSGDIVVLRRVENLIAGGQDTVTRTYRR